MTNARPLLCVVGGFLGAGKTTALLHLAELLRAEGRRIGLVMNDQADDLVDTGNVSHAGFAVQQVAGACFCCKFDDLARAVETLRTAERPDVLLAEPVGSCTDLAATVLAPFRRFHGAEYAVAPYSVLLDPLRARQLLIERGFGGFSPKVAYIFQKQLEEASVVCVSKCDLLDERERDELLEAVAREFPRARVLALSARTGEGFAAWRAILESERPASDHIVEVDYDVYAAGEAELGWLNLALELRSAQPFDADALVRDLVGRLARAVDEDDGEIAHIKALLESDGEAAVSNVVHGAGAVSVSRSMGKPVRSGRLLVNARVHLDPARLHAATTRALDEALHAQGVAAEVTREAHFRPGRPVPTHRFA